jgi:drug/metabolite transporter (DMT)-like permease
MTGSFSWAFGSLLSRHIGLPGQPLMATALEMMGGGGLLLAVGTFSGEWGRFDAGRLSVLSAGSLVYLTLFGSLVAFSAYTWLLKVSRPALVATYAYVNPVVAVFLGWWIGREGLTARTMTGAAVIVAAVILITTPSWTPKGRRTGGA